MKRFSVAALALVTLGAAACASTTPSAPPVSAASPGGGGAARSPSPAAAAPGDAKLATLDAMTAAAASKDARAIAALFAEDAQIERYGGRSLHGRTEIEEALRAEMAPAAEVRVAFGRVWIQGDVLVAEETYNATLPAGSKAKAVGTTSLDVFWFDAQGRIAREHDYVNQAAVNGQMEADGHAPPVPPLPASREVHLSRAAQPDASQVAWTNDYETACSTNDARELAFMDDGITWDCALGFEGHSKADMVPVLAHWRTALPDMKSEATQVITADDFVIVEEELTGTHSGKLGPFEASGRHVDWHWAEVWQVKNGKIARGWSYANWLEAAPQLTGKPNEAPAQPAPCSIGG
jgi:predicted ester cyclase